MSYETITYDVSDHVATIRLNRPERMNSIGVDMIHDLVDAIGRVDSDDDVRCAVVTGAGRVFCAGADLSKREDTFVVDKYDDEFVASRDGARAVALALYDSPKPFVAAINGSAVGFGLTLTLPMDVRICADNAKLGFVFSRRGMIIDAAASWFLPRIVSLSWAADWAYSGRMFSADEALRAGLVRELQPADAVLPAAHAIAAEIAAASPVSVSFTKALLWRASTAQSPHLALDLDSAALRELGTRPDCAEGVQAFLERRPPQFTSKVSTDMPAGYGWWQRNGGGD
ncbi:MAG: enoyl-CoA hydratase-related protein [Acidimicrobiales bacterium]